MNDIGGNVQMKIQVKTVTTKNAIGEQVPAWSDAKTMTGWLDLMSGTSGYSAYNAKIQDSTHMFLCDFTPIPGIEAENARAVIGSNTYDILLIDNPMELSEQLEIYLKYTGGQ